MTTPPKALSAGKRGKYGSQWQRKETPMRFTERDGDILEAIAFNRVLTRDLLLWLIPPNTEATPEHIETTDGRGRGTNLDLRLRKLYRNGYLDRLRTVYGGPFLYAISDRGAAFLRADRDRGPRLTEKISGDDWQEKNRALSTLFLTHTLAVARVNAALTVAGRATGWRLARFQTFGRELTVSLTAGKKKTSLRPDAVLVLTNSAGRSLDFFLEADRSTMHHDKMARKFRSYEAMHRANFHRDHYELGEKYRVLIVTKSPARAAELANLIAGDRVAFEKPDTMRRLFYIASETDFLDHPENIFADIWTTGARPTERAAIVPQPLKRQSHAYFSRALEKAGFVPERERRRCDWHRRPATFSVARPWTE
jgi:hypothetical protein